MNRGDRITIMLDNVKNIEKQLYHTYLCLSKQCLYMVINLDQ